MSHRELVWVEDLAGTQVGVIGRNMVALVSDVVLDQAETLTLRLPLTHPKAYLVAPDRGLRHRGRRYRVAKVDRRRRDAELMLEVTANADWYQLGAIDYPGTLSIVEASPVIGAARILAPYGLDWTVDRNRTLRTGEYSLAQSNMSLLALCRLWAKITGTFLEFDTLNHTVAWLPTRGANNPASFRVGRNLTAVTHRRTPPRITRLWPVGRDNLTIAGINGGIPYIEDLSYYTAQGLTIDEARDRYTRQQVWTDSSIIDENDLMAAGQARLAALALAGDEVELSVVDISAMTGLAELVAAGDTVTAQDPEIDGEWQAIVTRTERDWLRPQRSRIELSTTSSLVSDPSVGSDYGNQPEWVQYVGRVSAPFAIRSDSDWTVGRIPLRFTGEGRANFHVDLTVIGVGSGEVLVEVLDTMTDVVQHQPWTAPYTDGVPTRIVGAWAVENLTGTHDYRLRVTTIADGGPSTTAGVDLISEADDDDTVSFWVLVQNAVRETPVPANSITFDFTGAVQQWTIPDNVEEITITARGAAGGGTAGGAGGEVTATFPAVSGNVLDVYVGGTGGAGGSGEAQGNPGWPNGGEGGTTPATHREGGGGGGSSDVRPEGETIAAAFIVAAGGGAAAFPDTPPHPGGQGGFVTGGNGMSGGDEPGVYESAGATQYAGGAGGSGGAGAGTFGQGGAGGSDGNTLNEGGGGGGGGWFGGEGGRANVPYFTANRVGGAGGSGWVNADGVDLVVNDGSWSGHGQVVISWDDPA